MEDVIQSVGIVVLDGTKVLLVRHGEAATHTTDAVGLPGGRLETDETYEQCAIRELQEETGLQSTTMIDTSRIYYATIDSKKGLRTFEWHVFWCKDWTGTLCATGETEPFWEDIEKARNVELLPNVLNAIEDARKCLSSH